MIIVVEILIRKSNIYLTKNGAVYLKFQYTD